MIEGSMIEGTPVRVHVGTVVREQRKIAWFVVQGADVCARRSAEFYRRKRRIE